MINLKDTNDVQIWCDYQEETRQTSADFFLRLRFSNFRTFITKVSNCGDGDEYGWGGGNGYGFDYGYSLGDGKGFGYGYEWGDGVGYGEDQT